MARLFTCGFELQSTTANMELTDVYDAVINTSVKRSGAASMKIGGASIANDAAWGFDHTFSGGSSKVFARWYIYIDALNDGGAVTLYMDLYSGTTNVVALELTRSGSVYTVTPYYNNWDANLTAFNISTSPTGAWHSIEVEYDTTAANGSEVLKVRLDGAEMASATNLNFTTKTVNIISTGVYNGSGSAVTGTTIYIDDMVVNDSSGSYQNTYPGESKLICLRPSGAGDSASWERQGSDSGANWSQCEEITPNDATDYVRTSTVNALDMYALNDSGIGSGDTVNLVAVGVRFNRSAATSPSFKVRCIKTASGTEALSAAITPNATSWKSNANAAPITPPLTLYQNPDAAAWTQALLDTMQIGVVETTDKTAYVHVSALWAYVDYTPSSATGIDVYPSLFGTVGVFIAPTVTGGAAAAPSLFGNSGIFIAPTVTGGVGVSITPFSLSGLFVAPTVTTGAYTNLTLPTISSV